MEGETSGVYVSEYSFSITYTDIFEETEPTLTPSEGVPVEYLYMAVVAVVIIVIIVVVVLMKRKEQRQNLEFATPFFSFFVSKQKSPLVILRRVIMSAESFMQLSEHRFFSQPDERLKTPSSLVFWWDAPAETC